MNTCASSSEPGHKLGLLLIEDVPEHAYICIRLLRAAGYEVDATIVSDKTSFTRALCGKNFDVVISDYTLPNWDGMQALKALQEHGSQAPFILITGTIGEAAAECIKLGAADFLLKQNIARIGAVVRHTLREQRLKRERDEAIAAAERQHQIIFNKSPLPKWIVDRQTLRFLRVNEAAQRQYGYTAEDFLQMSLQEIAVSADLSSLEHPDGQEQNIVIYGSHRKKSGEMIDVEVHFHDIVYEGKEARLSTIVDITDRLNLEKQLSDSVAVYRSLFDHNLAGIVHSSWDARILACNPAFAHMLGFNSPQELIGMTADDFGFDSEVRERLWSQLERHGSVANSEIRLRRRDGSEGVFLNNIALDYSTGQKAVLGTMLDITDFSRLQGEIQKRDKLEVIDKMAGGLAHDFNNMLMVIAGNSELLSDRIGDSDDKARRYLDNVCRATTRGKQLTQQLLAFSRQQVLRPQVVCLNQLLRQHIEMLKPVIGDDIQLSIRPSSNLPEIKVDPVQMEQVLLNLLVNARDALPQGGRIDLCTDSRIVEADHRSWIKPGQYVVLRIKDNGVGMDAETQSKIFEPFFTTKEAGRGTGLGLAVVYGIVKQAGGFIEVESQPGLGTTFSLFFPVTSERPILATERPCNKATGDYKASILLVDDEDNLREFLAEFLTAQGHTVTTAKLATDAMSHVEAGKSFDILVTDVMMPGQSGTAFARELAIRMPNVQVLYMSGYSGDRLQKQLPDDDSIHFLQKPFSLEELQSEIAQLMDNRCATQLVN